VLKVLFFARVREQLECASLELEWTEEVAELDALQQFLGDRHGARWREVLAETNLIRAVNQSVVAGNLALRDGDEVAFFPPVTGG
jgi:molybdopterin synthase sulfur carrier subunit